MADLHSSQKTMRYDKNVAVHFGNNLRRFRKRRRLSYRRMADMVGLKYQTIYRLEQGRDMPAVLTAMMIADFFRVTLDEMFQPQSTNVTPEDINQIIS